MRSRFKRHVNISHFGPAPSSNITVQILQRHSHACPSCTAYACCVCVCCQLVWVVFLHYVLWSAAKGLQLFLSVHPTHPHLSPCSLLPQQTLSLVKNSLMIVSFTDHVSPGTSLLLFSSNESKPVRKETLIKTFDLTQAKYSRSHNEMAFVMWASLLTTYC